MKRAELKILLLYAIWVGIHCNSVFAMEQNLILIRSLYQDPVGDSHVTSMIWEFKPSTKNSSIDVYAKERSEKILTLRYEKDGRLNSITKVVQGERGPKEITINHRNPITLSEGFPPPYDYLAPFNDDLKQIEIIKQAGGLSFSTLYTRSIEKLTMKAALQLGMIDQKRAALLNENALGQELRLISIYKGNERIVRQLWDSDEAFWIFEETPFRKSWNITP